MQKSISLSSAESELCGSLLGVSEALFVASAIRFMCGIDAKDTEKVKVVHYVDNSAARAIIQKEGLGKSRHVELDWLWIQRAHKDKKFETKPISTALCPADLATKPHPRRRAKLLCYLVGMFDSEHQELFGVEEFGKREVKVRRIQSSGHANARVLQLVALLTQALVGKACSSVELQNTYTCARVVMALAMMALLAMASMMINEAVKYTVKVEIEGQSNSNDTGQTESIAKEITVNVMGVLSQPMLGEASSAGAQIRDGDNLREFKRNCEWFYMRGWRLWCENKCEFFNCHGGGE